MEKPVKSMEKPIKSMGKQETLQLGQIRKNIKEKTAYSLYARPGWLQSPSWPSRIVDFVEAFPTVCVKSLFV